MNNRLIFLPSRPLPKLMLVVCATLLPACGTEVGNGKKPPLPEGTGANTSDIPVPTSSASPGSEVQSLESDPFLGLIYACSSPIPEMKAGTFLPSPATLAAISVSVPETGKWLVTNKTGRTISVLSNATTSEPYAIKSSSHTLGTTACLSTTSVVTATGITRTALLTNNAKTEWTLNSQGAVTTVRVRNASGTLLGEWTVSP